MQVIFELCCFHAAEFTYLGDIHIELQCTSVHEPSQHSHHEGLLWLLYISDVHHKKSGEMQFALPHLVGSGNYVRMVSHKIQVEVHRLKFVQL